MIPILLAGCKTEQAIRNVADSLIAQPDPTVELLESELRWMEDNWYRLDDQLEVTLRQLDSTRRNNAALRLELAQRQQSASQQRRQAPKQPATTGQSASTDDEPKYDEEIENGDDDLFNVDPPIIDLGDEQNLEPQYELPEGSSRPDPAEQEQESILKRDESEMPLIEPIDNPFKDDAEQPPIINGIPTPNEVSVPQSHSESVAKIRLNPQLTGGYNFDGQPGHDGIMVVIEPQDSASQFVSVAGPVTVEVRDPSKTGVHGQIGKWSFTETDVLAHVKQTLIGKGIHLELPWPAGSPTSRELTLKVAFQTPQGKTLTATKSIRIHPTTSALVQQADAAEQGFLDMNMPDGTRVSSTRWKPTR